MKKGVVASVASTSCGNLIWSLPIHCWWCRIMISSSCKMIRFRNPSYCVFLWLLLWFWWCGYMFWLLHEFFLICLHSFLIVVLHSVITYSDKVNLIVDAFALLLHFLTNLILILDLRLLCICYHPRLSIPPVCLWTSDINLFYMCDAYPELVFFNYKHMKNLPFHLCASFTNLCVLQ